MKRAILLAAWLAVVSIAPARAQSDDILKPADGLPIDEHIAHELQAHRGVAIIDAVLMMPKVFGGLDRCAFPDLTLGQRLTKDTSRKTIHGSVVSGGKMIAFGAITSLPPGEHLLLVIACGNTNSTFNGPHAKFLVRAGEIVNVGAFRLKYESAGHLSPHGTTHRSVENVSPDVMAYLKTRAPAAMTKVVRRPMTMLGTVDTAVTKRMQTCTLFGC